MINRAGPPRVQPQPGLPFPTPVEQAYWAWMQTPTQALQIVTSKPMLVPAVIHSLLSSQPIQAKMAAKTPNRRSKNGGNHYSILCVNSPSLHFSTSTTITPVLRAFADGPRDLAADAARVEALEVEFEAGEGGSDAGEDCGLEFRPEEVELDVLLAGGVLEDGGHGGDGVSEVVGVESHGDVDPPAVAGVAVSECRGFSEDGSVGGGFVVNDAVSDGHDGGGGGEEERQEAEEEGDRRSWRAAPNGHPAEIGVEEEEREAIARMIKRRFRKRLETNDGRKEVGGIVRKG
ncbi:hypothetical protein L484_025010 [Morus notabilis]|uniref:Uncharacterized protein n=1 Tax=Morus notabilis TaxID=981085 RepID=W9QKN2_9ROSA|nr:hypothetical protein L484_025010 [Morus notabilis]